MGVIHRSRYYRMHPARIFGHSKYVGRKFVIDCLRDGEDAQIRSSDAIIRVKAKNFAAIARYGSTAQA